MYARICMSFTAALVLGLSTFAPAAAQTGGRDPAPNPTSAALEVEFLQGMVPHHRSAIMMAEMAVQKASRPELRELAQKIIDDQEREIAEMSIWLRDWYGMDPAGGMQMPMGPMMEMMPMLHNEMPDMDARMQALRERTGAAFDIEFMSAMVDHHAMAIGRAVPVLIHGHHADLVRMAEQVVIAQGEEIKQMDTWLDEWYGVRRPLEGPPMVMEHPMQPSMDMDPAMDMRP